MSIVDPRPVVKAAEAVPTPSHRSMSDKEVSINPSRTRRTLILLSFPLIFLLAVPYWWHTTSIERLPLPVDRIAALEHAPITQVKSKILFTAAEGSYPSAPPGKPTYTTADVVKAMGGLVKKGVDRIYRHKSWPDRAWDFVYEDDRHHPHALHMRLVSSPYANLSFPLEGYVQTQPGAFGREKPGTLVIPVHPDHLHDRNLRDHLSLAFTHSLVSSYPNTPPDIPLRALKYSPNITLSFVLLNEDSAAGSYVRSWDIEDAIKEHFRPHLQALSPVFNFTVESQVLYHAPLSFEPEYGSINSQEAPGLEEALDAAKRGDEGAEAVAKDLIETEKLDHAYRIGEDEMKVFVNSERWSLDSGSSQNPVLRFLLFIPSAPHRPMRLSTPTPSAQSFLLPQFGGVVLLEPPSTSASPSAASGEAYHLSSSALTPSFHLFTQHLYSLLALPTYPDRLYPCPPTDPRQKPSGLIQPFSRWQLETVLRQRMRENEDEARKTLAGIVRLVSKIKEMQVGEGVRGKVLGAVERLEKMATTTDPLQAFLLSRDAVGLANEAFFDPSMMGLLYFPNEHKFAVYTPLFAPVAVPIMVGLLKELIGYIRRRRARRRAATTPMKPAPSQKSASNAKSEKKTATDDLEAEGQETVERVADEREEVKVEEVRVLRSRSVRLSVAPGES